MVTRRCSERRGFLRPDSETVQAWLYVLGYCQQKYGVAIHEFQALSNHEHISVTDSESVPKFFQDFHSLVARCLNARWGHWESFWDPGPYNAVREVEDRDAIESAAYILTNAVDAGLVRYVRDWGGPTTWHIDYGGTITVQRPAFFFSSTMPESVTIRLTRPPICPALSDRELRQRVRERALERQCAIIERKRKASQSFLGMRRVLRQPREDRPRSRERRRGLRPTVAARARATRIRELAALRAWRDRYAECRRAWCSGRYDVVFPFGTYLFKVRYGARVEEPPSDARA